MKKTQRKLIPAVAMLLISAIMLSTSSFAWFSINTTVEANGMKVKATADPGIVIANESEKPYGATATSTVTEVKALRPTSTPDTAVWYKNVATVSSAASAGANPYTSVAGETPNGKYYQKYTFYIKAADPDGFAVTSLDINTVVATSTKATDLDQALRVAVKVAGDNGAKFFAPLDKSVGAYNVQNANNNGTTQITTADGKSAVATAVKNIPANGGEPIQVDVFVYFEGEDEKCFTDNLTADVGNLEVKITFGFTKGQ